MKRRYLPIAFLMAALVCCGCGSEPGPCPTDLADFETFTMNVSGCLADGSIAGAVIVKDAEGSYVACFGILGEQQSSAVADQDCDGSVGMQLSEVQAAELRELFDSVRCDARHPLLACPLQQDQNQTCTYAIFGWDEQYAPDWTCHMGGQFTVLLEDSQRIREFLQGLVE